MGDHNSIPNKKAQINQLSEGVVQKLFLRNSIILLRNRIHLSSLFGQENKYNSLLADVKLFANDITRNPLV